MNNDNNNLPSEGFVTLRQILSVIPVCKTSWYNGIKTGAYPRPIKLGRSSVWRVETIRKLIDDLTNVQAA